MNPYITRRFIQFDDRANSLERSVSLIVRLLKEKAERMKTDTVIQLGEGFQSVTSPWALVFVKDTASDHGEFVGEGYHPQYRKWLDSIRICKVETVHQIRAVLAALHVKQVYSAEETGNLSATTSSTYRPSSRTSILDWKENVKYGQPPSLIFVIDLLDILVSNSKLITKSESLKYLNIDNVELGHALAILVETCVYESTYGKRAWEAQLGGVTMNHITDLYITDNNVLPALKDEALPYENEVVSKLHHVLAYYLDNVYMASEAS